MACHLQEIPQAVELIRPLNLLPHQDLRFLAFHLLSFWSQVQRSGSRHLGYSNPMTSYVSMAQQCIERWRGFLPEGSRLELRTGFLEEVGPNVLPGQPRWSSGRLGVI